MTPRRRQPRREPGKGKQQERLTPQQEQVKQELNARLNDMLLSGMNIEEIARMLGAEKYLYQKTRKGQTAAGLNAQNYLNTEARKAQPVKLPEHTTKLRDTILPPDEQEIITGSGEGWKEREIIPRTEYMQELLTELELDYDLIDGTNTENMMRSLSYKGFVIPDAGKIVMINDEEDQATYIIHELEEGADPTELVKKFKKSFWRRHPELASVVKWVGERGTPSEEWKNQIVFELQNSPEVIEEEPKQPETEYEYAPKGWLTRNAASLKLLGRRYAYRLVKLAETYRDEHPEWFEYYLTDNNRPREHLAPALLEIMEPQLTKEIKIAPDDCMTIGALHNDTGIQHSRIKEFVEPFRESHPKWFEFYGTVLPSTAVREDEYLLPALIERVYKHFGPEIEAKKREVPTEWITLKDLAEALGLHIESVRNRFLRLKDHYSDDCMRSPAGKRMSITWYISPAFAEAIKNYGKK